MSPRAERIALAVILVAFVVLALTYSVVVPPFEASDELWHYPMVKVIADTWRLPVQDPANVGPWRQEGSQPPLYYFLGALATAWIDTSDMPQVRHLNPHVDNGVATPDGNINLVVHNPQGERFPWRGTVLAVHLVRLLSVVMSAAGVYLTWRIAHEVVPGRPVLALGATAIHAFTPMFVFISGAVNNDNLVLLLSSLALLMLIRLAKDTQQDLGGAPPIGQYLLLGVVLGLAALTKASSLALTVLTAVVVVLRAHRRRSWREFLLGGGATLVPLLALAGWWYLRNLRLYGDLSGLNVFIEILGKRDVPADLVQLWRERYSFAAGYWGNFGGLNVPMPAWSYGLVNAAALLGCAGLLVALGRWLWAHRRGAGLRRSGLRAQAWVAGDWSLALCLLWGLGVLVPWSQWASVTWSSQGRLIFAALPVWSLLLVLGLAAWLPRGLGRWLPVSFGLSLLGLAVAAPAAWIAPAYAAPVALGDEEVAAIANRVDADFGGTMRLLGYELSRSRVVAGDQLTVTLYWEALAQASQDLTVFVHLLGSQERLVAGRDTLPGMGRLSAQSWTAGFQWADRTVLQLPDTAFAPDTGEIEVGVYDPVSGARLPVATGSGDSSSDCVRVDQVEIAARAGDVPNPVRVEFDGQMALVGYDLDRLAARPGEQVTVTLYWQALTAIRENYTVSVQLVDAAQRKAAQRDAWPQDGAAPTATWRPGQAVVDAIPLEVATDAVADVYDLRLVVYRLQDGSIAKLPVVPAGGRMMSDHVVLTRVRVIP